MTAATKQETIRVIIADDHPFILDGTASRLNAYPGIRVVGTANSFEELTSLLPQIDADIIVLDLGNMSETVSPMSLVAGVTRSYPHIKIVVLSSNVSLVPEMLKAGAKGYVAKGEPQQVLLNAVLVVSAGHQFLSEAAKAYLEGQKPLPAGAMGTLTPQQELVVKALVTHPEWTTEDIANYLGIALSTVHNHITEAKKRYGVGTRFQLCEAWRLRHPEL